MPAPGYLAIYDVTHDREREKVATLLEGFGHRVQYSAFELRLSSRDRTSLLRRLEELNLTTGWVALYRRAGGDERAAIGVVPTVPHDTDQHSVIIAPTPNTTAHAP